MTELDIPALLQALAEQQTALLAAHAESTRVQRVLIEHLMNTGAVVHSIESGLIATSGTPGAATENHVASDAARTGSGHRRARRDRRPISRHNRRRRGT